MKRIATAAIIGLIATSNAFQMSDLQTTDGHQIDPIALSKLVAGEGGLFEQLANNEQIQQMIVDDHADQKDVSDAVKGMIHGSGVNSLLKEVKQLGSSSLLMASHPAFDLAGIPPLKDKAFKAIDAALEDLGKSAKPVKEAKKLERLGRK